MPVTGCLLSNQATKLGAQAFAWLPSPSYKQVEFYRIRGVLWRAKSHFVTKMAGHGSPKFNEPWMDELDGENCIQRTVSFAVQGALVGR